MAIIPGKKPANRTRALWWYGASLLVWWSGAILAAWHYPGGFDWLYTVVSALASQEHNPEGSIWFASALSLSMVLLWPWVTSLKNNLCTSLPTVANFAFIAFRIGIICGALLGLERLLIHDLSHWLYKGHEIIALVTFLGLYGGVFGLLVLVMFRRRIYTVPVLLITVPILAIGITQFWLYLDQRGLGWVDVRWREMGIPVWFSFAFWQWLALGFLWLGAGMLTLTRIDRNV